MSQPPSNQYTPPPTFPGQPSAGLYPPGPSKTSGMAIASLVCGILGCIPILPGLLAVLFGFIGIRATSKPGVTGRGLAIAGLILGLLGLIGWTAGGGLFAWGYVKSGPDRAVAKAFVTDLSSGNIAAAQGLCAPGTDPAQLQATSDQIQAWGTLQSFTPIGFGVQASTGSGTATQITGPAIFSKTTKTAFIGLGRDAAGKPIIESWRFQ